MANGKMEMKKILIELEPAMHNQLKSAAAITNHTTKEIVLKEIARELAVIITEVLIHSRNLDWATQIEVADSGEI